MRKTMVELAAEIAANFPDNNTGLITPAKLREFCQNFVDTMTPAYGAIQTVGPLAQTVGLTNQLLPWQATYVAQNPEWTTDPATGKITRTQPIATNRIYINMDVELAANREMTATLYKNGAPTVWRSKVSGSGTGRPAVLALEAIDYSDVAADYQLYVQCDAAGTNVSISNGIFIGAVVPVRTA